MTCLLLRVKSGLVAVAVALSGLLLPLALAAQGAPPEPSLQAELDASWMFISKAIFATKLLLLIIGYFYFSILQ